MCKISFTNRDEIIKVDEGSLLLDCLVDCEFVNVNPACGGNMACGGCTVEIVDGEIKAPSNSEVELLNSLDCTNYTRLSCQIKVTSDLKIVSS